MPALWAYAQLHVVSMNVTGLSPWNFLTAGTRFNTAMAASGTSHEWITLKELTSGVQYSGASPTTGKTAPLEQMGQNLQANFLPLIFSMVGIKVAKRLIVRLGVTRSFNKLSDSIGMGSVIRG